MHHQQRILVPACLLIVLAGLYCFNPFALWFQNDDLVHISLSAKQVFLQRNTFRPVCDLSIMLDYLLWGKEAYGYHITNLLLHSCASVLAGILLHRLLKTYFPGQQAFVPALLCGTLFFVYGMHSESVFWILGRSAVLTTIFSILFLYCFVRRRESIWFIIGYNLFFVISLLTYESSWMLPVYAVILLAADQRQGRLQLRRELLQMTVLLLLGALYMYVRWLGIHEIVGAYEAQAFISADVGALMRNFSVLVVRSLVPPFVAGTWIILTAAIAMVGVLWLLFRMQHALRGMVLLLAAGFIFSLVPCSSLGVDTNGTEGERFLYFPSLLLCMAWAVAIWHSSFALPLRLLLGSLLVVTNLLVLFWASGNYRFAGQVVKTVAGVVQQSPADCIVAEGLPQAQYGALIFRSGFPELVEWFSGDGPAVQVVTCNTRSELAPLQVPYPVVDSLQPAPVCSTAIPQQCRGSMLYLSFTDTALLLLKQ